MHALDRPANCGPGALQLRQEPKSRCMPVSTQDRETVSGHRLCVAPMMTHTDRHFRYFLRLLSRRILLYTEMISTGALLHGKREQMLAFDPVEHPIGIQLGGSDPLELAKCAALAESAGYDEINLNTGCPSDRVQAGRFGACLMLEPETVAECIRAIRARVRLPVTVKCRIGVDDSDDYPFLRRFVSTIREAGCTCFMIHARKAWLTGLSPRQNREVPALDYDMVYRIKRDFPSLEIILNGGVTHMEDLQIHYRHVDGVMIGRTACNNPYMLASADRLVFGENHPVPDRKEIFRQYLDYVEQGLEQGVPLSRMLCNITGLFQGQSGARKFRRYLGEIMHCQEVDATQLRKALDLIRA